MKKREALQEGENPITKLNKKFKGLILSKKVLNVENIIPPKEIKEEESEDEFISNLYQNVLFHSKNVKSDKNQKDRIDENKYLQFLENSFNMFPLKKVIYKLINDACVPAYPSVFLFPLLYIIVSDIDNEIDTNYKVLVLDEIKLRKLSIEDSEMEKNDMFGTLDNQSERLSCEYKKLAAYIGYKEILQQSIKSDSIIPCDKPGNIKMLNTIISMMPLELNNQDHLSVFKVLEDELRIISATLEDKKWAYFFRRIREGIL